MYSCFLEKGLSDVLTNLWSIANMYIIPWKWIYDLCAHDQKAREQLWCYPFPQTKKKGSPVCE